MNQLSEFTPAALIPSRRNVNGVEEIATSTGGWQPVDLVKAQELLEDEAVRKVMGFAIALSEQVARFKGHAFEDLLTHDAILFQEYGVTKGGAKGNRTYNSHCGHYRVRIRVQDQQDFGPELQAAKALIDECLVDWSEDAHPALRAVVTHAFKTDQQGKINRNEILTLRRWDIDDTRWLRAMDAIGDAVRVVGTRTYMQFQRRKDISSQAWETITIDLAKA